MADGSYDVVVVGGGNAALCAALAANQAGARVLVLERAPKEECGGNSRFTSGSMRFPYNSVDDLRPVLRDLSDAELERLDFGAYPEADFFEDMFRVTKYRTDPQLCEQIVTKSYDTACWLASLGIRFIPRMAHAFEIDGRYRMSPGIVTEAVGGGEGLIERQTQIALKNGVSVQIGRAHV